ncbi:hydrocephalus-inducing protein homolog, partial [Anomalospiza imberbis]|uniref:hydrocephalus-inducing protein homolog n=1 Tax=Anomalospiza imberbis TaxID=187417 RepID=UPI00358FF005
PCSLFPLQLPSAPLKQNLFQISSPEVVFQNFVVHEVSEMVLSLINKDKIPQVVKVSMESSPYFQLACSNNAYRVVPPETSVPVRIRFTPDENKDYSHELVCIIAKERIVVPIRAIAARAILDFPDQLDFPVCPVKYSTQKTLLVRNVGNRAARYQLSTQSPFFVVPATGTLGAGDSMRVTVGFQPLTTGDHSGSLCCNTGEESIHTNLHGEAVDLNIGLSTNSVEVEKTFITMSNPTTVFIENRSNITAHFQWKTFPTEEDENEEKRRQCLLQLENFTEKKKIKKKRSCEDHTALLRNMFQEEVAKMQQDPMLFSSDIFFIEPVEGEIGPNSWAEIKVTFKPLEALEYQSVAYCSISGRESRLPLHLKGEGQGPLVKLSRHTLNLGNVFVNTPHVYEVKLINQVAIDAPFTYIPSTTNAGYCFKFAPEEGIIAPGGIQTIQICFNASVLGTFEEEFQFRVAGSPTPAILTIKGCVTGSTLHFDVDELSFGDISFGFPYTQSCRLTNTCPVPVTFKLRMLDEGTQPAVNSFDQIRSDSDPSWREGINFYVKPREFTMNPSQGTILPQGHQDIEVTLCSNTVMEFYQKMLVDLEGIGKGVASLTITARCLVPELQVYPRILFYDECQLKVPYQRKFLIANNTDLPGCYGLIPQKREEDSPVFYSSPKPCGIVQPHSVAEIPVIIEVQTLVKHRTDVLIGVFGDERNPLRTELWSSGRLAKIYPSPRLIEFGKIPALQPTSQSFTLFNNSLVPTDFRLEILCKPHCYAIEPREGVIPARGEVPVTVTASLDDTEIFGSAIQLSIGNSLRTACGLVALGTGTTIVIDKPFAPELNLGYQFSLLPCIHRFKVTNGGHHFHRLFWSVGCCSPPEEEGQGISALSSPKDDSQSPKRATPVFGLEPLSKDLQPGESVDIVLRGFSRIAQEVQDYVLCEAVIGTSRMTQKIIETTITCKFIHPSIEASARQFSFYVEKKPSDVLTLQYQPLALKNTCLLPLDLMLDLEQPFLVCDEDQKPLPDGQPVTVDVGETCHLYIAFDPAYELDFKSWKTEKVLKIGMVRGHPYVERITLRGEVHFPNLQIQPSTLDFGCIVAGTEEVRSLEITNCSPLPVEYRWSFHSDNQVNKLRYELYPPKFKPQPPKEKRTCLDCPASRWRHFKIKKEEAVTALKEVQDFTQSLGAEVPPQTPENPQLALGLEGFRSSVDVPHTPLETEKAFSIVPVSGVLQPGESQQVSFTFFGHLNTITSVRALCHVEGGPTYEVVVTGEASRVSYSLSLREINCGSQMFNEIGHSTVTLENTCRIEFNWVLNPSTADQHLPGVFLVKPTAGSIAPGEKQVLKFSYMPGLPGAFSRTYQLKVGDLDLENILLKGEASCPMITVNLPWNAKGNEKYEKPPKQLIKRRQLYNERNKSVVRKKTQSLKTKTLKSQTPTTQTLKTLIPKTQNLKPCVLGSGIVVRTAAAPFGTCHPPHPSPQLQVNTVRMLIEKASQELQQKLTCHPPKSMFPDEELCQSLVKVEPPEYVLDMGAVHKGYTERRTLEITNPEQIPVSFQVDLSVLQDTGFSMEQVQDLPHSYTKTFDVRFESAQQPRGDVDVLLPLKLTKGPTYNIRLHATVSELLLELSKNRLHFSDILVGQCKAETIQLYNWFRVPCKWSIKPVLKNNHLKYMTSAVRQKQQPLEDEPCPFEVTPSKGTLGAGRWQNLQIRFTPKEERSYKNELKLNIRGSSNHLNLHLSGQSLEPRLEFSPPALKMGRVLVDSDGVEATVVVKNPCNFPIEFYSLDFDEQYLEEEEILRMAVGSEYQKSFLMPPCAMGETLSPEVLEDHEAQKRLKAQQAEFKAMAEAKARTEAEAEAKDEAAAGQKNSEGLAVSVLTVVTAGTPAHTPCKKPQLTAQTKNKQASGEKINRNDAKGKNLPAQKKEPASKPDIKDTKFTVSTAPAPQQLNIISSHGEELNCLSCVLPKDLLVDVLCERLKCKDCYKGVVFDGLETLFASSLESSLLCVLRAVKNCHHIYMVNLHQDYASWKAKDEAERKRKEAEREKEEPLQEKAIMRNTERVLEMDEDEYDILPEEKNPEVDKIILEMKSIQPEGELKELAQKLEEEAKPLEEEERQKEEEKQKKEKKGVSVGKQPAKPEKKETKAPEKGETKAPKKGETKAPEEGRTEIPEDPAEMEKNLILRFQIYESSQQNVAEVFSYWDRVRGTVQLPVIQKGHKSQPSGENKGLNKTSKPQEKVKKPEHEHGGQRSLQSSQLGTQSEAAEGAVRDEHVGVPCLDIQVSDPKAMIGEILWDGKLPTEDQMLKHLGLHPNSPPLPPAAVLSTVEYPEEWLGPAEREEPFTIVAPGGAAVEDNLAKASDVKGSSAEGQPKTGKAASRDSSAKEKQISTQRTESPQDSSAAISRSTLESASVPTEFLRLKRYRWIVPAHGEVDLKVHFSAKKPRMFEQTLRFELVQSKRQYELPCSGTGLYPSISLNPRVVFPQWRETMEEDEIIFKEYVESTKQFHFGPLLCGKSREWYEAQNCPSNSENITILNNSPVDAEVQFSFENAGEAETFLLDPPSMALKPKEKQELTIWAYPTSPGFLEDRLICSIGKNPDPVVFSLCCRGVHMKLDVSPLELSFDKLLLHRTDSRTLVLRNNTLLPMAWQLSGLDDLVEDFSLSQDNGTIDPRSEFEVTVHFEAGQIGSIKKSLRLEVSDTENILGIVQTENIEISAEVYDISLSLDMPEGPDGSLEFGTIHVLDNVKKVLSLKNKGVYNIEYSFMLKGAGPRMQNVASYFTVEPQSGMLTASQPDVNIEMLFHPTSEILLKNKPILYCQVIDASSGEGGQVVANIPVKVSAKAEYSKYSIEPASPTDFGSMIKGTKKTRTLVLKNKGTVNFKFHIRQAPEDAFALESKSSKQGESAPLATKLSTGRKSSSSTQGHLNLGMFTVSPCSGSIGPWGQQMIKVECLAGQEGTCEEQLYIDITGRDPKDNPLGIPFTLIAESCLPALVEDVTLIFKEYLICSSTDLSHKLQSVKGTGLFVRDENRFIFNKVLVGQEAEAHFRIYNASHLPCDVVFSIKPLPGEEKSPINNIFKLDPVKASVPGSSCAVARVTFTPPDEQNYNCTFTASLDIPNGSAEIKPKILTFTISGKGHEPQLTVVCPSARSKRGNAVLRFKRLRLGDSETLPLVVRNNGIIPVKFMLHLEDEHGAFFLKGRTSTQRIFHTGDVEEEDSIGNGKFINHEEEGLEPLGVEPVLRRQRVSTSYSSSILWKYFLCAAVSLNSDFHCCAESKPTKKSFFFLRHGQSTKFDVIFKPTLAQRLEGKICLLVGDICMTLIELVGEGHKDEFTLSGLEEDTQERNAKSSLKKDIIDAVRVNHIQFGHCHIGKPCRRTFTITNHTRTKVMRFEWEADAPFQFSPKVGHLHPGCAKNITVILKSDDSATFRGHLVKCKVTRINFELPRKKVPDWDDQMCIVTWKDTTRKDPAARWPKKEKVVKIAPEPAHTVMEESSQEVEVYLSAVVTYAQFELNTTMVQFGDTSPFQTRTAIFRLCNTGKVALEYSWEKAADSEAVKESSSTALTSQFLSAAVRRCIKLLHRFGWQKKHPFETHPSELRQLQQLAKQQQDSKQQLQQ